MALISWFFRLCNWQIYGLDLNYFTPSFCLFKIEVSMGSSSMEV